MKQFLTTLNLFFAPGVRHFVLHLNRFRSIIRFGSAGCGSGKIHQIVKSACRLAAADERVIIRLPQSDPPLYTVLGRCIPEGGGDGV